MARPFRFTFILALAALGTGLAAVGGWRYARASAPVNGPIVLISIDTLRADHLPLYGYHEVRTPAIDAIASDGTVFDRAYSHAPQTLPAHASLLSGRLPFETGVRDNVGFAIKPGERLLPQMLRDRGYVTGAVVSSYVLGRQTGIDHGFDFFDDGAQPAAAETAAPLQRDGADSEQAAERWLDGQRSARVFLFLHLYEPHKPYAPPSEYAEYAPYDGEIAYADHLVGRLIQYLKSHQLYDQSTIILLSDHGEGLGDHGEDEHGLLLYDEAIHVPLIIKPAGGITGRRVHDVVQHIDIVPTILDLARAPIPGSLRGRSLKSVFDGTGSLTPQPVYSEALFGHYHFGWTPIAALTEDRFRFISSGQDELYDLVQDPHEHDNIAAHRADTARTLRSALDRLTVGAAIEPAVEVSSEQREWFEGLGYVGFTSAGSKERTDVSPPANHLQMVSAYRHAAELASDGQLMPAIDALQQLVGEDAAPPVWRRLGDLLARAGRYERAARAYERVAASTDGDADALIAAAASWLKVGRLEEAKRDAESVIGSPAVDARDVVAGWELIAKVALARKDPDGARAAAAEALGTDPSVPLDKYVDGLLLYNQGRFAEALDYFRESAAVLDTSRASARGPAAARGGVLRELHFYTAEALARLSRWNEAIHEYERELDASPHNLRARANLAIADRSAGRSEDAERALDDLIADAPSPEGYTVAARASAAIGNGRRADVLRAEAGRLSRNEPGVKLLARTK